MSRSIELRVADATIRLWCDRALQFGRHLIIADVHFGKDQVFRQHGLAIPEGATGRDLVRLDQLLTQSGAEQLIVLGDLAHTAPRQAGNWVQAFRSWRQRHAALAIKVVLGNHDRAIETTLETLDVSHCQSVVIGPFHCTHEPQPVDERFNLSGHLHPYLRAGQRPWTLRAPIFWQRPHQLVLPAFGTFTGGYNVQLAPGEQAHVCGEDDIVSLKSAR